MTKEQHLRLEKLHVHIRYGKLKSEMFDFSDNAVPIMSISDKISGNYTWAGELMYELESIFPSVFVNVDVNYDGDIIRHTYYKHDLYSKMSTTFEHIRVFFGINSFEFMLLFLSRDRVWEKIETFEEYKFYFKTRFFKNEYDCKLLPSNATRYEVADNIEAMLNYYQDKLK